MVPSARVVGAPGEAGAPVCSGPRLLLRLALVQPAARQPAATTTATSRPASRLRCRRRVLSPTVASRASSLGAQYPDGAPLMPSVDHALRRAIVHPATDNGRCSRGPGRVASDRDRLRSGGGVLVAALPEVALRTVPLGLIPVAADLGVPHARRVVAGHPPKRSRQATYPSIATTRTATTTRTTRTVVIAPTVEQGRPSRGRPDRTRAATVSAMIDNDFDAHERSRWAGRTAAYERSFGRLCAYPADSLLDAAAVRAGRRMLDVGTGPGTVAARALRRGAEVVAVDAEPTMLDAARRHARGAEVRQGTLPDLPFPAGGFDCAVANFVLNHVGDPAAAAAELRRVVRPGGRVAVTIWPSPHPPLQRLWGEIIAAAKRPRRRTCRGWRPSGTSRVRRKG